MELLSIAEVARRSGVAATTLRYYDSVGLLTPVRLDNNHRRYPPDTVERLRLIRMCQALGCTLQEIRHLVIPGGGAARRAVARTKLATVEQQIQQLTAVREVLSHLVDCTHTELQADACRAEMGRSVTVGSQPGTTHV